MVGDGGFLDLADAGVEVGMLRQQAHRVAVERLRPAARVLDAMTPAQRIEGDSPFFDAMATLRALGYHRMCLPKGAGGEEEEPTALAQAVVLEELGWASLGLATAFLVDLLPLSAAARFGGAELREELVRPWADDDSGRYHGCWAVTEPDHGSDYLSTLRTASSGPGRAQVVAESVEGGWLLRGQKSAWVSSAPVATHAAVHAQAGSDGDLAHALFAIVALHSPGVRRGPPSDMLGIREEPQGELFFEDVFVPERNVLVPPGPFYPVFGDQLLCMTSAAIANVAVGVARAAFEEALAYARQRVQGGVPIVEHKNIRLTLYAMFERVETARAYSRSVLDHVQRSFIGSPHGGTGASPRHSRAAQVFAKRAAYDNAHDAVQVCGAYGLSRQSLVEKLFRDARCLLIEDGTIEILGLDAAGDVIDNYEREVYDLEEVMKKW